jgi:hypothetical protein
MSRAAEVQARVTAQAEELTEAEHLIDIERPDPKGRLTFEQSMQLIRERYSNAIELLGKL